MDPGTTELIRFLRDKKYETLLMENGTDPPYFCLLYGQNWIPVLCYVMKFISNSEEEDEHAATLKNTISLLNGAAHKWESKHKPERREKERQLLLKILLQDFGPQVQKYFKVPTKMPSVLLNQNEILAAFMDFLLQIWNTHANREGEQYEENCPALLQKNQSYAVLHKELKFLLTLLGDVPFQCTHDQILQEDLETLLGVFEILANHAGHFTFIHILSPYPKRITEFAADRDALLQMIEMLNVNIKQYCITFSKMIPIPVTITSIMTRPIDSLFIIDSLLEDVERLISWRFNLTIDVDMEDQVGDLYEELKLSRDFLKDTNYWLNECFIMIREIAYEVEYLINSYVAGKFPIWYLRLRLPSMIQKLKVNWSRLQEIKKDCEVLHVTGKVSFPPMETSTTVVEDHLVGIQESKKEILGDLTGRGKNLKIISLIGKPGLGKTTLAKNLYGCALVQSHFDIRAWCVVSQNYEKSRVLVEILTSVRKGEDKTGLLAMDDEYLVVKIKECLCKRRYLIVIDDIWSSSTWDEIRSCFKDDSNGSRIMFTSRYKDAAPKESIFRTPPLLSEKECLDLLLQKVFLNQSCPPYLMDMGKRLTKRCHGLPLAIVTIAGVLTNLDKQESVWLRVERNLESFISDDQNDCMKVLEFCYEHLPDHLKLCYLYFGTFTEYTEIPARKIKRLWIAEGFIQKEEQKTPEDVAGDYLHELINRGLVLIGKRKYGAIKSCGVHTLLHGMCLRKSDEGISMKSIKQFFSMYVRHHRLRVDCDEISRHFGLHCRSFSGNLSDPSSCFPQMPLHRVIDLSPYNRLNLELKGIDMLVHLRYLCAPGHDCLPKQQATLLT